MSVIGACMRCGRLTILTDATWLHLCRQCPLLSDCGEYQHAFAGTEQSGIWGCLRCGVTLGSVTPVLTPVVIPPPQDIYC